MDRWAGEGKYGGRGELFQYPCHIQRLYPHASCPKTPLAIHSQMISHIRIAALPPGVCRGSCKIAGKLPSKGDAALLPIESLQLMEFKGCL